MILTPFDDGIKSLYDVRNLWRTSMFYTRPVIEPLGWDLSEFGPAGAFYFAGRTTDDRPVEVKYRSSWLQVWRGEVGATETSSNDSVVKVSIGPPFHGDMLPEQVCDILGLTIQGKKPVVADEARFEEDETQAILDWSGKTTYWQSWHFAFDEDVKKFVEDVTKAFADTCLVQFEMIGPHRRCRSISFVKSSDDDLTIGIGVSKDRLKAMLNAEHVTVKEISEAFRYTVSFDSVDSPLGRSNTVYGKAFIDKYGADKLDLKYETLSPRKFRLKTDYPTLDEAGKEFMEKLLSILNRHFFKGYQIIDLQTKSVLKVCEEGNLNSFSMSQKEWCHCDPNRYLSVHVETADMREEGQVTALSKGDKPTFYGLRPLN